jgi:hypothetical protein
MAAPSLCLSHMPVAGVPPRNYRHPYLGPSCVLWRASWGRMGVQRAAVLTSGFDDEHRLRQLRRRRKRDLRRLGPALRQPAARRGASLCRRAGLVHTATPALDTGPMELHTAAYSGERYGVAHVDRPRTVGTHSRGIDVAAFGRCD